MISAGCEIFAGGPSGLVVFSETASFPLWRLVLEDAERRGLSGLLTDRPSDLAPFRGHGVERVCIAAAGPSADAAFTAAQQRECEALIILSPPASAAGLKVEALRLPRLLLCGNPPEDVAAMRALDAASRGPVAQRIFPYGRTGAALLAAGKGLVVETICLFAVRSLGAAARPTNHRAIGAHTGEVA